MRAVKHWKRLPSKAVESPSLETSKMWPDKAPNQISNFISWFQLWSWPGWMWWGTELPSNINYSVLSFSAAPSTLSLQIQFNSYNKASLKLSQYLNGFIPRLLAVACFYQDERNLTARFLDDNYLLMFSCLLNIFLTVICLHNTDNNNITSQSALNLLQCKFSFLCKHRLREDLAQLFSGHISYPRSS